MTKKRKQQKHWWAFRYDATGNLHAYFDSKTPLLVRTKSDAEYRFKHCFYGKIVKVKVVGYDD